MELMRILIMLLIALLMTSSELPAATANIPLPQLRQDFVWTLRADGTYGVSNAFRTAETPEGRIRTDTAGPHVSMPELEDDISSGGLYCYTTPYYSQKDRRWSYRRYGSYYFGNTGCVPSALAMIFSGILGTETLPPEIGDYLHYDMAIYNGPLSGWYGAGMKGIVQAAGHYHINCRLLDTYDEFEQALKEGKCVCLLVNYIGSATHAYVCMGWHNGFVYVKDSDSRALSHYYDARQLWQSCSSNSYDRIGNAAAAALWGN